MGMPLPPIYRDCRRLLVHTEGVVQRFARYHKYTVGTDLRQQAIGGVGQDTQTLGCYLEVGYAVHLVKA